MKHMRIYMFLAIIVAMSILLAACAVDAPPPAEEAAPQTEEVAEEPAEESSEEVAEEEAVPESEESADGIKIGFLAGVQDPFYFTMQRGAEQAAADLGVELVVQIPENWNATVQTPMLDAMVAAATWTFCSWRRWTRRRWWRRCRTPPTPVCRSSPTTPSSVTATMSTARSHSRYRISAPNKCLGGKIACRGSGGSDRRGGQGLHPECQAGHQHHRPA